MLKKFGHSELEHTESTTDLEHWLSEPIVAVPLYFGLLLGLFLLLKNVIKLSVIKILVIYMGLFFLVGVLSYSLVPAISIISLVCGMALALFFTLSSVGK